MNKRIVSVLMVLALLVANFCFTGKVKALDDIRVYATETNCNAGEQITIPIRIENNTGLMGFAFIVSYDNKKLSPISVINGDLTNTGLLNDSIATSKDNTFKVNWSASDNVCGDGVLFNIKFNVLENASGDSDVELSYVQSETYDNKYYDVPLSVENISVHITGSDPGQTTEQITTTSPTEGNTRISAGEMSLDNSTLVVPVCVSNNHGLMGYKLEFAFDNKVVTPISATNSSNFPGSFDDNIGLFTDKFNVIWSGVDDVFANGELLTLKFNLLDSAVSDTGIKISYSQKDTFRDKDKDVVLDCESINVDVDKLMGREKTTKSSQQTTTKKNNTAKNNFKKKKPKIKKLKALKKRRVKIKIKKIKGANGYQIKYAKNKKFKKAKIKNSRKPIKVIKKLKKKKYFFKVRAYRYFSGSKVYTKWSKKKKIRVRR